MHVVVTGSEGFIGSAICRVLTERGHTLTRVDLMTDGRSAPPGVHQLDVRRAREWSELLAGADVVCHQAAKVGAAVEVADGPEYASHNIVGTAELVAAMELAGVQRLVLASSMVVYGEGRYACPRHGTQPTATRSEAALQQGQFEHPCPQCGEPMRWALVGEDGLLNPRGAYAASKLAQESFARSWAELGGGSVVALRYHNVYGPQMPRDTPYSGVAAMFRSSIERGDAPVVYEDGRQVRDFVHVSDVARANLAAIETVVDYGLGESATYNVCSGVPIEIGDVAGIIGREAQPPRTPHVTGQYRASDVRHVVADPARARDELGFTAAVRPQDGLARFVHEPLRDVVTTSS